MALVDVDRHILRELVEYHTLATKKTGVCLDFLAVMVGYVERIRGVINDKEDVHYTTLRKYIRKVELNYQKMSKLAREVQGIRAKEAAFMEHLVTLIKEIDTQKGKETK